MGEISNAPRLGKKPLILLSIGSVSLTVTVEGEIISEETASEGENSLLPGPSFLSVVGLLALIVFRRKN